MFKKLKLRNPTLNDVPMIRLSNPEATGPSVVSKFRVYLAKIQ